MEPKEVIERLFEAENSEDADGVARPMHDDVESNLGRRKVFGIDAITSGRGREAARDVYQKTCRDGACVSHPRDAHDLRINDGVGRMDCSLRSGR